MKLSAGPGFLSGLALGVAATLAVAAAALELTGSTVQGERGLIDESLETIRDNYFEEVGGAELDDASVRGMVRELRGAYDDRFSHYFSPDDLEQFESATSGRFSGIGLTVSEVSRGLRVASIIPDSPAAARGFKPGDLIVAVDGESIAGLSSEIAVARIKGPPGT